MPRVILSVFVLALWVGAVSCSGSDKAQLPASTAEPAKEKKPVIKVVPKPSVVVPKTTPESQQIRLIGEVSSQDKILLSFKVSAIIRKINVKTGSKVSKGDVVAEVDDSSFKLYEAAAKFQLEKAENLRAQAKREYDIEQDLRSKDISSVVEFQDAELAYKNAEVAKKLAQVDLLGRQGDLGYTRLTVPVDGVISRQFKFVGDQSTGGDGGGATFEMFALGNPEIFLNAPESLLSKLKVDTELDIYFPAIGSHFPAKIIRIVPVIREDDRTFVVIAKLIEANSEIVPGLFAEGLVNDVRK